MLLQLAPFTLLPLFAQLTCATGPNWTISNGTGITPYIGNVSSNPTTQVNDTVYNRILLNHGYVDRLNYIASLNDSSLWKFNFNPATAGATASRGAGGLAVLADKATFPALINTGVSMAMGFLEPCELVVIASGGPLKAGAIWSNSASSEQFNFTAQAWELFVLPQGTIHYVFNDNCHPTVTVNAFTSEDPGILNPAQVLFKFNPDILNGTLDYPDNLDGYSPYGFREHIPPSYVLGSEACLARCGLNKTAVGTPGSPS